jgi:short-subunit dehydrogenase
MAERPNAVLLTGASSGIGRALALAYAEPGTLLHLGGRDAGRLEAAAQACRARGAMVETRVVDVTDADAMAAWVAEADGQLPLDLVIASAGIYEDAEAAGDEPADLVRRVFAVNVQGTFNTVLPALPFMRRRGRGKVVLISSFAGFRGLGGMPAYGASKAAVRVWGEGLRAWLAADGVVVTVVCPGHVRTPMCPSKGMAPEQAARLIRQGVARGQARVAFPLPAYARAWVSACLPPALREGARRLRKRLMRGWGSRGWA